MSFAEDRDFLAMYVVQHKQAGWYSGRGAKSRWRSGNNSTSPGYIKKVTSHKPDSVVGYHLSVAAVTRNNQSAYPSALERAAPPVYMAFQHTRFTRKIYYYIKP